MGEFLRLEVGAVVSAREKQYKVEQFLSLDEFVGVNLETRKRDILSVGELTLVEPGEARPLTRPDIFNVPEDAWKVAEEKYLALQPLLKNPGRTRQDVIDFAVSRGCNASTIYRHLRNAQALDSPLGLVRRSRLEKPLLEFKDLPESGELKSLDDFVLAHAKKLVEATKRSTDVEFCRQVAKRMKDVKMPWLPHVNTVRGTMLRLSPKILMTIRKGRKAGLSLDPLRGEYAEQHRPYQVFQIDHTPLNVIVVDDKHRQPIGRGWVSVVIEIGCRVVPGFGVSLDAPSIESVSTAIRHAVLRKEQWLAERNIKASWPIFGKPVSIHADNANEFRGDVLKRVCESWDMNLIWRPVAQPRYGAHIERFMGTLATMLKDLSGCTFANVVEKADHDPENSAVMTLDELEAWLVQKIAVAYHHTPHSGIGDVPPIVALTQAMTGTADKPGIGRPPLVKDERRLYLDFLPRVPGGRTISREGVLVDSVHYGTDYLTPLIGTKDPDHPTKSRKYPFAQDRRQISPIYLFDERINDYIDVPYANPSRPQASWWELQAARQRVSAAGGDPDNEEQVFRALAEAREIEASSEEKTKTKKKERREAEKKRLRAQSMQRDEKSTKKTEAPPRLDQEDDEDDDGQRTIVEIED